MQHNLTVTAFQLVCKLLELVNSKVIVTEVAISSVIANEIRMLKLVASGFIVMQYLCIVLQLVFSAGESIFVKSMFIWLPPLS